MRQLTLRGFEDELEAKIRELAAHEGISLNKAALRLLRKGAGLSEPGKRRDVVGSTLDHLMGTWTEEEAAEFGEALEDLEGVDESLWR